MLQILQTKSNEPLIDKLFGFISKYGIFNPLRNPTNIGPNDPTPPNHNMTQETERDLIDEGTTIIGIIYITGTIANPNKKDGNERMIDNINVGDKNATI